MPSRSFELSGGAGHVDRAALADMIRAEPPMATRIRCLGHVGRDGAISDVIDEAMRR